jgi:TIR domain
MASSRLFEKHLFISYAHIDNEPLNGEPEGWVSQFHRSLETMLSMRMGCKAEIWRDRKLDGNDNFGAEILAQFPKTALLISVLTPRYVDSDWCTREVREFCKAAEQAGGVFMENKSRVIKVIKTPVEDESPLVEAMKDTLGYPFYVYSDDQAPIELDPAYGPDIAQKYNLKVAKLVWDISQQIKKLETTGNGSEREPLASKPTVYLAESSWDQRQAREALEAELRLHGYSVLPDRQLPREETGYLAEVARLLDRSSLSIHLVGATYGAVPDGPSQKSIVVLQNEAAVERSRKAGLRRVIWVPEGTSAQQVEQQQFIDTLQKSAEAQFGADLMICDLETLKDVIHATLEKLQKPPPPQSPPGEKLVYLIFEGRDRQATIPLRKFLKNQGLDIQIPLFEGDAATVRQNNQDLLTQCDGVIVFYGAGDESWKRTVDSDLRKIKGSRDAKRPMARCTYLAEPATDDKRDLIELEEPDVMNGLGGFSEAGMKPFLQRLRSKPNNV